MCLYKLSSAWTIILILSLVTGQAAAQSLNERKEKIRAMETKVSPDSIQRKSRSEATLRTEGVPINKSLPVIESEKDAKRRTKEEVAYRTLALLVVAVKGEGLEQSYRRENYKRLRTRYSLHPEGTSLSQKSITVTT